MSGLDRTESSGPQEALDAIEARAVDFLQRRRLSRWGDEDRAELDAWLNESTSHRVAWLRHEAGEALIERVAESRPSETARSSFFPRRTLIPALAASLALAAGLGLLAARQLLTPADHVYSTEVGGRATIEFSDGTQMALNTDTLLRVRMTASERTVWLEKGEAFFRVAHDPENPFSVIVGRRRITDLGTEFLVRDTPDHFEVALIKGRAQFSADGTRAQVATLTPGDDVVATGGATSFSKKTPQELEDELTWRQGVLKFRHTRLGDAVKEFNRYYRTKLVIDDPAVANMAIGGDFRIAGINEFLQAMQDVLGLKVERAGDNILIAAARHQSRKEPRP